MGRRSIAAALLAIAVPTLTAQKTRTDPGLQVFGIVRDLGGKPVVGAEVSCVRLAVPGLTPFTADAIGIGLAFGSSTRTNQTGKFVVRVRHVGRFGIVARLGATFRSGVIAPASPGKSYELKLYPVRRVRGRAFDVRGGKEFAATAQRIRSVAPVRSGVDTRPWPDRHLGVIEEVTTDAKGWFEIAVLAGAKCAVELGMSEASTEVELSAQGVGEATEPVVVRRAMRRIECRIVDAQTRAAVPNARIHVADRIVPADAKGRAVLDVPLQHHAYVCASGYLSSCISSTQSGAIEVVLTRGADVRMRLIDAAGKPHARVTVCVFRIALGLGGSGPIATLTTTDAAGGLTVTRPAKFGCVLWAKVGGRYVRVCEVPGGATELDLGNLSTVTASLRGTILGVDGVPAAHLPVFAGPVQSVLGSRLPLAQYPLAFTDHAGRFVIRGLPRRLHSIASRSPRSLVTFGPETIPGSKPIRLRLLTASLIQGRAIDEDGRAVAGAIVSASVGSKGVDPRVFAFGLWTSSGRTDEQGRFALPAVAPEAPHRLRVMVRGQRSEPQQSQVDPPAKNLELVVRAKK